MTVESEKQSINFMLHLILFFITASLWAPFYNLLCFLKLNKLAELSSKEKASITKNSAIANFLLALSFIGLPFALYRRFHLLHDYIETSGIILPTKKKTSKSDDNKIKVNCISPRKYIGFAITSFILICILVSSITIASIYVVRYPIWGNDALLLLYPIGMACFFISIGFCVRTIKEEKNWSYVFNEVYKIKSQ